MLFNLEQVKKFLPHRSPFLFVDSIEKIYDKDGHDLPEGFDLYEHPLQGSTVKGRFFVAPELELFQGHFPGRPILPGVIQVEIMAQVSGFLLCRSHLYRPSRKLEVALVSIKEAKFRKPIFPSMDLSIFTELTKIRGQMLFYEGKIYQNDQLMSEASFAAVFAFKD